MRHGIIPIDKKIKGKFNYLDYIDQKSAMRGQQVYEKNCYNCHGDKGKGDGPMATELDTVPANLQQVVKDVPFFKFYLKISKNRGTCLIG
jgi:mono/diheme cytochrome c family protein